MIIRVIVAAVLGAVVQFAWGSLIWMATPLPFLFLHGVADEEPLRAVAREHLPASGVYLVPWMQEGATPAEKEANEKEFMRRHREGPLVQIIYVKEGMEPMAPQVFALGFVHFFIAALLAATLLAMNASRLCSYLSRVLFVVLLAVFAVVLGEFTDVVWMHHPLPFPTFTAVYTVLDWLLVGLVMAAIIRPRPESAA